LPLKLLSPPELAVRVLAPDDVDVSAQLPAPPLRDAMVQVPPVPSETVTDPDGVPAPGATAVTVTLTVYAWPTTDGSGVTVPIVVAGFALFTVCGSLAEVLPLKCASPP